MKHAKVAISIDEQLLKKVDFLVVSHTFKSRSQAFQEAIQDKLSRLKRTRLAEECAKLNKKSEQKLAEEGLSADNVIS